MWFKNLQIFLLTHNNYRLADNQLRRLEYTPCASNELQSQGWDTVRPEDQLLFHVVNKQTLLSLATEKKLLPTSVVNEAVKTRCAELEEEQGFAPGRKAVREIKERVTEELIPRAFTTKRTTGVWIDTVNGWLVIDASAPSKADEAIKALLKCCDSIPLESLRTKHSPVHEMTGWLAAGYAPEGFTIDQDAVLRSPTEDKATVKYVRYTLDNTDIQKHLGEGKQCVELAMTWRDRISFVLTETLTIKRVKPLDILAESRTEGSNETERFDADFVLMAGELNSMLTELVHVLGGEMESAEA